MFSSIFLAANAALDIESIEKDIKNIFEVILASIRAYNFGQGNLMALSLILPLQFVGQYLELLLGSFSRLLSLLDCVLKLWLPAKHLQLEQP